MLVLSELAGAASYLTDALIVNPYDVDGIADAMQRACGMPALIQKKRMKKLRSAVAKLDVHAWAERYLAVLEARA